jgi:hypothetical protein
VRAIEVQVRPLGGDHFPVTLDARKPAVGEAKVEIARIQGTRKALQELYRAAVRSDGKAVGVRENDAGPEILNDSAVALWNGDVVAMAVKEGRSRAVTLRIKHNIEVKGGGRLERGAQRNLLLLFQQRSYYKVTNASGWRQPWCSRQIHTYFLELCVQKGRRLKTFVLCGIAALSDGQFGVMEEYVPKGDAQGVLTQPAAVLLLRLLATS